MITNDRIKLAEAMGGTIWEAYINPGKHPECVELPDPYTDANDDYAVLEWMRKKKEDLAVQEWAFTWTKFTKELNHACWYKIGDYARAALKVLDG